MEFESFQSGTLLHIGLQEGESAKVDSLLAIIGPKGTDVSAIAKNFKVEGASEKTEETPKTETKVEAWTYCKTRYRKLYSWSCVSCCSW